MTFRSLFLFLRSLVLKFIDLILKVFKAFYISNLLLLIQNKKWSETFSLSNGGETDKLFSLYTLNIKFLMIVNRFIVCFYWFLKIHNTYLEFYFISWSANLFYKKSYKHIYVQNICVASTCWTSTVITINIAHKCVSRFFSY